MKLRLFLACLVLALAGCASAPTKNAAALKAYQTIDAYVLLVENRIDRGITSKADATAQIGQAKKARATVAQAEAMLAGCKVEPCGGAAILDSVQPLLLEYERQLRQGSSK